MRKWPLLVCVLIGISAFGGRPNAQAPAAAFHAVGDLPGGGATTIIRDATQSGGVIYAVGGAVTRQTTCGGVPPPGAGPCAGTDTPILWRFDGINPATLEALPDITPSAAVFPLGNASDITPDGRYVANQTRKAIPGLALMARSRGYVASPISVGEPRPRHVLARAWRWIDGLSYF